MDLVVILAAAAAGIIFYFAKKLTGSNKDKLKAYMIAASVVSVITASVMCLLYYITKSSLPSALFIMIIVTCIVSINKEILESEFILDNVFSPVKQSMLFVFLTAIYLAFFLFGYMGIRVLKAEKK